MYIHIHMKCVRSLPLSLSLSLSLSLVFFLRRYFSLVLFLFFFFSLLFVSHSYLSFIHKSSTMKRPVFGQHIFLSFSYSPADHLCMTQRAIDSSVLFSSFFFLCSEFLSQLKQLFLSI